MFIILCFFLENSVVEKSRLVLPICSGKKATSKCFMLLSLRNQSTILRLDSYKSIKDSISILWDHTSYIYIYIYIQEKRKQKNFSLVRLACVVYSILFVTLSVMKNDLWHIKLWVIQKIFYILVRVSFLYVYNVTEAVQAVSVIHNDWLISW